MRIVPFFATFVAATVGVAASAAACSYALPEHSLDPEEQTLDTEPPEPPEFVVEALRRGVGAECPVDGVTRGDSCDDLGQLIIRITNTGDDRTPDEEIGYEVELVGDVPEYLQPDYPVRVEATGTFRLVWIDGATHEQEPLSFGIALRAIDLAGNMSDRSEELTVTDPGSTEGPECPPEEEEGCATASGMPGPLGLVVGVVAVAMRRRRG